MVRPLLLALLVATPLAAQSRVHAEVDTTLLTVGDRITLTVSVDHPAGTTVAWPDSLDLSPFEVLGAQVSPPAPAAAALRSSARLTLTAFELGELEIPAFAVEVRGPDGSVETLETDRFGVEVHSVGEDSAGDIRDIRGPLAIPVSVLRIALGILLPLVLLALSVWLYLRRRRRKATPDPDGPAVVAPARPPHEVALEALAALEGSPLLERGQVKEYHIAVSDILRRYVEGRFGVPALEMTTWEVMAGLEGSPADPDFKEGLRRFLEPCDLVKFAKVRPDAEASGEVLRLGRRLVEQTIPSVEPAEPEAVGV